jgi:hypothetical protein
MNRLLLCLLIGTLALCENSKSEPVTVKPHPSFQLDAGLKRALVEKAVTVKRGDSYEVVLDKLGKPSRDEPLIRKEDQRYVGRSLKYYALIWETGLVNELNDELVDVFLDESNHCHSVYIRVNIK